MSRNQGQVLIVDDNPEVLTALKLLLKEYVSVIHTVNDPSALPALLREEAYDTILLDMNFTQGASSGNEGFRWLSHILRMDPDAVIIMITAYGDVEKAVRAMKEGASDFVVKPWKNETLFTKIMAAVRLRQSRREAAQFIDATSYPKDSEIDNGTVRAEETNRFGEMIGAGPAMQRVFETIEKVAQTDANVVILGEHGTGKELVARSLHQRSRRAARVFLNVDLGALSENLFESELFGHVKGAFTGADRDRPGRFELASGGTLFLDEIGNIPLFLQRKLLTVLERREVNPVGSTETIPFDIRLICATNMPIYEMTTKGSYGRLGGKPKDILPNFREDLLYRINTVEIHLPPLRDRKEDIPLLAEHFRQLHARSYRRPVERLSTAAIETLKAYHWPGNVREFKNTMERAIIMSEGPTLEPADFLFSAPQPSGLSDRVEVLDNLDLEEIEHRAIRNALSKHGGNISRAAEELGLTRRSLYRRIEKYGL